MIRWLNWIAVCSADALAPVATPLKKRKQTVATALSSGPGRRMRMPRANAYAPAGISTGPIAVVSLSAMPYGRTVSRITVTIAGTGK
jgi:hypothetical protein